MDDVHKVYSRQQLYRAKKNPEKNPKAIKKLQNTFPEAAEALEKGWQRVSYPITDGTGEKNILNDAPADYNITKNTILASASVEQKLDIIVAAIAKLQNTQQVILAQQKTLVQYTAQKEANGDPKKEKEILDKLTKDITPVQLPMEEKSPKRKPRKKNK